MKNYHYEINVHTAFKAFVIFLFGGEHPVYLGMVPSCVVKDFGLGSKNVVDESVVDSILIATDKAFETYDSRLNLQCGNSSEEALATAKYIDERDGWTVLYDRNGYPLIALMSDDYEQGCNYFPNDKYLDEKVAWYFSADGIVGKPDEAVWPKG